MSIHPKQPPKKPSKSCSHKWVHRETIRKKKPNGRYNFIFTKIDYYFCEKCLDEKEKCKSADCMEESPPEWY